MSYDANFFITQCDFFHHQFLLNFGHYCLIQPILLIHFETIVKTQMSL